MYRLCFAVCIVSLYKKVLDRKLNCDRFFKYCLQDLECFLDLTTNILKLSYPFSEIWNQ